MNYQLKNNLISKLLAAIYGIILFGPHRIFDFNYVQEILLFLLFVFFVIKNKYSKKVFISFIFISIFYTIKIIQLFKSGIFDPLILLSIPAFYVKIGGAIFCLDEKLSRLKDLIFIPFILCLINSTLINLQFIIPSWRFITTFHSKELTFETSNRYFGIAHDGFQITTFISCIFLVLIISYSKLIINSLKIINIKNYFYFILISLFLIPISWLFQGRLSQLLSIAFLIFSFIFINYCSYKNKLEFFAPFTSFKKKLIIYFGLIVTIFTLFFKSNINSFINSKPITHALEFYTNINNISSISSIKDILDDKNLFDYMQNINQWLIGNFYSGRGNFPGWNNVDFDNGFFLLIFKFGIVGSFLILLITFLHLFPLFKKSKLSLVLFIFFIICNYKEKIYFSGASYLSLFVVAKIEFILQDQKASGILK